MTQSFVPGYGPVVPNPSAGGVEVEDGLGNNVAGATKITFPTGVVSPGAPGEAVVETGVGVHDEGLPIPGGFQKLNFVGAGVTAADAGSGVVDVTIPGGGGAVTGFPDALLYENPTGTAPISDAALVAAPVDVFGRPQIWDYRQAAGVGAVFRQGQWSADGDPSDIAAEGFVTYGPANGVLDPANGMIGRVKSDRLQLRRIVGGVDIGSAFRVDMTEMYLKSDANVKTFNVDRASGNVVAAGTIEMFGGGPGTEVLYPIPTGGEDRYAAYADSPQMGYASTLRFVGAPRTPTFFAAPKLDNSLGYTVITFDPSTAPAGPPFYGTGNGILLLGQRGALGTGGSGGDVGIQGGNASDVGASGGIGFVQAGASASAPDNGEAQLRNASGASRVAVGGAADGVGFHGTTPIAKPTVTGSRGGNAAVASLLTQLESYGLIVDSTTP